MDTVFQKQFAFGKLAEGYIASWLRRKGYTIIPVYELEIESGKGPQIFTQKSAFISPDLLVFKNGEVLFVEAKRKSVFTWYRIKERWETGIDLRHYEDYLKVKDHFGWRFWLLFLHENKIPSPEDLRQGSPGECPSGLFGQDLDYLRKNESHRSVRWGRSGMVYWAHEKLKFIAPVDGVKSYGGSNGREPD